jgi:hypothetical protein
MMLSKIALIVFLGSCALHVIIALALIQGMGSMPRGYDAEWMSGLFRGRNGRLLAIAACNMVVMLIGLAIFMLAGAT